jgi:hypothetical protein
MALGLIHPDWGGPPYSSKQRAEPEWLSTRSDGYLGMSASDPQSEVRFLGIVDSSERGAPFLLWAVRTHTVQWLPAFYAWWRDAERTESVRLAFFLFLPPETRFPALDLRKHSAGGRRLP